MQRYNQRMLEQLKVRQQQQKARLPKIQRSEGKTRMAIYKKSLHIAGAPAAEQRDRVKQVRAHLWARARLRPGAGPCGPCLSDAPPHLLSHPSAVLPAGGEEAEVRAAAAAAEAREPDAGHGSAVRGQHGRAAATAGALALAREGPSRNSRDGVLVQRRLLSAAGCNAPRPPKKENKTDNRKGREANAPGKKNIGVSDRWLHLANSARAES